MKVKICGITRREDALAAARAGAEMVGFIFYAKSPRAVSSETAAAIIAELPREVTPVGVFVNAPRPQVEATIRATGIRMLQFSGDESPADCAGYALRLVKAFRFRSPEEAVRVRDYEIAAALLDPAPDGMYGGSGLRADPAVALAVKAHAPLFLAGGLSPETILEAVRAVDPFACDVNSGVESAPGIKDHARLRLLFERLRDAHEIIH
jgi:phosphoribosylanthranilate isomerase